MLFQLELKQGDIFQNPAIFYVCLFMCICERRVLNVCCPERSDWCTLLTMLTYLRISVTSLRRTLKKSVIAVKCEPQLRSHSLSLLLCFLPSPLHSLSPPPAVSHNHKMHKKGSIEAVTSSEPTVVLHLIKFIATHTHSHTRTHRRARTHTHRVIKCFLRPGVCQASQSNFSLLAQHAFTPSYLPAKVKKFINTHNGPHLKHIYE